MELMRAGSLLRATGLSSMSLMLSACGESDDAPAPTARIKASQACDALAGKSIGGATLTAVTIDASGSVPTHCKVNGTIKPSLNFDSGHQGAGLDASFALNDAVAAQLFGSLAVPTVMSTALEVIAKAYGSGPTRSCFEGCSNDEREALMAAQRLPNLFDGIVARAPAHDSVGFAGQFHRTAKAIAAPGAQFSTAKLGVLSKAVRDACDAHDGIVEGIVSNPRACSFDPVSLRCAGGAELGDSCLSDAQLAVVEARRAPASWARGAYTSTGWSLTGNEDDPAAWSAWVTCDGIATQAAQFLFQDTTVKNHLARNPAQDSLAFEWESELDLLYSMSIINDATNPDLSPFKDRNAKLILWHGGNDAALSPNSTADYVSAVMRAVGGPDAADEFMRYYIAPGVNHGEGGPGADQTDLLGALDAWVEKGAAPGTLAAAKIANGAVLAGKPPCRYPQYPRCTGPANDRAAASLTANHAFVAP